MPDLAKGQVGPETTYDLAFVGGALVVTLNYVGKQASFSVAGKVSAAQLVDALAQKVSNQTEKALLLGLESIIAAIP